MVNLTLRWTQLEPFFRSGHFFLFFKKSLGGLKVLRSEIIFDFLFRLKSSFRSKIFKFCLGLYGHV